MKQTIQRILSIMLAVVMLLSNTSIYLAEEAPETAASLPEAEKEAIRYKLTLPFYEQCSYKVDGDAERNDVKDIILWYPAEEKAEVSFSLAEDAAIDQIHVYTKEKQEIMYTWPEETTIAFTMSQEDAWLEISFLEPEVSTEGRAEESTETTEPGMEEEQDTVLSENAEIESETDKETEPLPDMEAGAFAEGKEPETSDIAERETELEISADEAGETEAETIVAETEEDGLPKQGSMVQTEGVEIPFDTWEFDPYSDFRGIPYDTATYAVEYLSDDISYTEAGTYSSIYRIETKENGKFWYVLRPVIVLPETLPEETELGSEVQTEAVTEAVTKAVTGAVTEAVTEESTDETEDGAGTETESETDLGQETESEMETGASVRKKVLLMENDYYTITLSENTAEYLPGDRVSFTAIPASGVKITDALVSVCERESEAAAEEAVSAEPAADGYGSEEPETGQPERFHTDSGMTLYDLSGTSETADEIRMTKEPVKVQAVEPATGTGASAAAEYEFIMPEEDVVISCETDVLMLAAAAAADDEIVIDSLKLTVGDTGKAGQLAWVPAKLRNNNGFSNIKYVTMYDAKGNEIDKVLAYCMNPSLPGPAAGDYDADQLDLRELANDAVTTYDTTVSTSSKSRKLARAMYYLYKGPAWGKTVTDKNGTSVNYRQMMIDAGCSNSTSGSGYNIYDDFYFITHMVLAYINQPDGNWNYAWSTANAAVGNALNTKGQQLVKTIADSIAEMPSATTELSEAALSGSYDTAAGANCTPSITYTANEDNVAKITLPAGTSLVNETSGKTANGTVTINGGDTFHLSVNPGVTGKVTYNFKTTFAIDFSAYRIVNPNQQDIGFAFKSGGNTLSLTVTWPSTKIIELQKQDKDTGRTEAYSSLYSFAGAEYGIYSDSACKKRVSTMTTDETGYAKSGALSIMTYYVKESKAPKGYQLDPTVYQAALGETAGISVKVTSVEEIKKKPIELQKQDKDTGKPEAYSSLYSFAGAVYGIYSGADCKTLVSTMTTDLTGYGKSDMLPF